MLELPHDSICIYTLFSRPRPLECGNSSHCAGLRTGPVCGTAVTTDRRDTIRLVHRHPVERPVDAVAHGSRADQHRLRNAHSQSPPLRKWVQPKCPALDSAGCYVAGAGGVAKPCADRAGVVAGVGVQRLPARRGAGGRIHGGRPRRPGLSRRITRTHGTDVHCGAGVVRLDTVHRHARGPLGNGHGCSGWPARPAIIHA